MLGHTSRISKGFFGAPKNTGFLQHPAPATHLDCVKHKANSYMRRLLSCEHTPKTRKCDETKANSCRLSRQHNPQTRNCDENEAKSCRLACEHNPGSERAATKIKATHTALISTQVLVIFVQFRITTATHMWWSISHHSRHTHGVDFETFFYHIW